MYSSKLLIGALALASMTAFTSCSDSHIHLERSTTIDAPADFVWSHVNSFDAMNQWSPWTKKDPNMTSSLEGTDGAVGAIYKWSGDEELVGTGSQTITEIADGSMIKTHMVFEGMGEADATIEISEADGKTNVTWHYDQDVSFPVTIFMMMVDMEEELGPDYQTGMDNLKAMVESAKAERTEFGGHAISKTELSPRTYIGVRETVAMADMQAFFEKNFPLVFAAAGKAGREIVGSPSGLYFTWDEAAGQSEMMAAVPVAGEGPIEGFESFSVGGDAIMIDYFGSYEGSGEAHMAMEEYMKWHSVEMNGPAIEEYVNSPMDVADPSELNTKIYYPTK